MWIKNNDGTICNTESELWEYFNKHGPTKPFAKWLEGYDAIEIFNMTDAEKEEAKKDYEEWRLYNFKYYVDTYFQER